MMMKGILEKVIIVVGKNDGRERHMRTEKIKQNSAKKKTIVLKELAEESRTIILYEAPHHLIRTLEELKDALGDRKVTVCRELTKKFETVMPTTLEKALRFYEENEPRGEYVLVIQGKSLEEKRKEAALEWEEMPVKEHVHYYESQGMDRKEAMKLAAKDRGIGKREVYRMLLGEEQE